MRIEIKHWTMKNETEQAKAGAYTTAEKEHKTLTINLDLNIHNKLIHAAAKQGCTPEELISRQISKLLQDDSEH